MWRSSWFEGKPRGTPFSTHSYPHEWLSYILVGCHLLLINAVAHLIDTEAVPIFTSGMIHPRLSLRLSHCDHEVDSCLSAGLASNQMCKSNTALQANPMASVWHSWCQKLKQTTRPKSKDSNTTTVRGPLQQAWNLAKSVGNGVACFACVCVWLLFSFLCLFGLCLVGCLFDMLCVSGTQSPNFRSLSSKVATFRTRSALGSKASAQEGTRWPRIRQTFPKIQRGSCAQLHLKASRGCICSDAILCGKPPATLFSG